MNYTEKLSENFHHFKALNAIMEKHGWPMGAGSYMIDGRTLDYNKATSPKQELLFNTIKDVPDTFGSINVLEVNVYAGHSALIMLMADERCNITAIDLCYPFTEECVEYLRKNFGNRITLYKGDSHLILNNMFLSDQFSKYDLFHLDGNHNLEHACVDFVLAIRLLYFGSVVS